MRPSSAREAVQAAFAALTARDVAALVALVHPDALTEFKKAQVAWARMQEALPDIPHGHPPMRRPVSLLEAVFKIPSTDALEDLDPETVLARWLTVGTAHLPEDSRRRVVLGEVPEGDSIVHVVFREDYPDRANQLPEGTPLAYLGPSSTTRVVTVKWASDGWAVLLNGGIVYDDAGGFGIGYGGEEDAEDTSR